MVRDHAVGPTACKVTQPSLRCRTAPDPTALPNPALTPHGAAHVKTPLTAEPSCKDEARVGQQGTLSYVWAPIGSRPARVRDCRHESAYLFGAICPARAVGAAIVMPWVSSEAMTIHLKEISKQVGVTAHALLTCDGAGWHQPGVRLAVPDNITLLRLPPYAPELNPMENVWAYMRGNQLSMTVWNSYTAILDACCDAWNSLMKDAKRIISITTRDWAQVKV
jgi:hypothetical protein